MVFKYIFYPMDKKPKLLIFDVNETLLDMAPLRRKINSALKNDAGFAVWFQTLLHYSLVETVVERYRSFSEIAVATFQMTASQFNVYQEPNEIRAILSALKELKAHDDASKALPLLKSAHFKLVALTNGDLSVAKEQVKQAGIHHFFDAVLSVADTGHYKPHRSTYEYALATMNFSASDAMLVAAHGWDVFGAQRAGLQTCFVQRKGQMAYPLAEAGELSCSDLMELVTHLTLRSTP